MAGLVKCTACYAQNDDGTHSVDCDVYGDDDYFLPGEVERAMTMAALHTLGANFAQAAALCLAFELGAESAVKRKFRLAEDHEDPWRPGRGKRAL